MPITFILYILVFYIFIIISIYFSGGLVRGRMQGQGEMTWPSGDKYIGDWEGDTRHGFGLYLYHSGNRYKGQYVNGQKVGRDEY